MIVCTVEFVMCRLLVFLHILIAAQVVVVGGFYVFHVCCLAHGSLRQSPTTYVFRGVGFHETPVKQGRSVSCRGYNIRREDFAGGGESGRDFVSLPPKIDTAGNL